MYKVIVVSNSRYKDEEEWYTQGEYEQAADALSACHRIVQASYRECGSLQDYQAYADDPFILSRGPDAGALSFSAWTCAKELSESGVTAIGSEV